MKGSRGKGIRSGQPPAILSSYAFRGNRHSKNLWKELLPGTQAKLISDGLFNKDGSITAKGLALSKDRSS